MCAINICDVGRRESTPRLKVTMRSARATVAVPEATRGGGEDGARGVMGISGASRGWRVRVAVAVTRSGIFMTGTHEIPGITQNRLPAPDAPACVGETFQSPGSGFFAPASRAASIVPGLPFSNAPRRVSRASGTMFTARKKVRVPSDRLASASPASVRATPAFELPASGTIAMGPVAGFFPVRALRPSALPRRP